MFGFVTKSHHRREIIALGHAYRDRIEAAERRARKADEEFNSLVHAVTMDRDIDGAVRVMVRLAPVYSRDDSREVARRLAQRIMEMLFRLHEDWRRDALTGEVVDLRVASMKESA